MVYIFKTTLINRRTHYICQYYIYYNLYVYNIESSFPFFDGDEQKMIYEKQKITIEWQWNEMPSPPLSFVRATDWYIYNIIYIYIW